jgi:hypothetical protein
MFAVKGRPRSTKAKLYSAPLPNVGSGGMCWGTVMRPTPEQLMSPNLEADWAAFLGSRFGTHNLSDKSKQHKNDLRKLYLELEGQEKYPMGDLIPLNLKFGEVLKGKSW